MAGIGYSEMTPRPWVFWVVLFGSLVFAELCCTVFPTGTGLETKDSCSEMTGKISALMRFLFPSSNLVFPPGLLWTPKIVTVVGEKKWFKPLLLNQESD